jgi:hypothetical protein
MGVTQDQRLRFFTARPDLSHRFLARLTQIDYARAERIEQLYGCVLEENATMLRVRGELGFSVAPEPGDPAVRRVVLGLA